METNIIPFVQRTSQLCPRRGGVFHRTYHQILGLGRAP